MCEMANSNLFNVQDDELKTSAQTQTGDLIALTSQKNRDIFLSIAEPVLVRPAPAPSFLPQVTVHI